jgi:hypothetical protein
LAPHTSDHSGRKAAVVPRLLARSATPGASRATRRATAAQSTIPAVSITGVRPVVRTGPPSHSLSLTHHITRLARTGKENVTPKSTMSSPTWMPEAMPSPALSAVRQYQRGANTATEAAPTEREEGGAKRAESRKTAMDNRIPASKSRGRRINVHFRAVRRADVRGRRAEA